MATRWMSRARASACARLDVAFRAVWPQIVAGVGTLPLADPLTITRNEVRIDVDAVLRVSFDFEAD